MSRSRKLAVVVVVSIAAIASGASADALSPDPFPVEIRATQPGSVIRVRGAGHEYPCGERCVLSLTQHQYRVFIRDPEGHEWATALNIMHPTRLSVAPGSRESKDLGIGLFAGGVVAAVVGVVVLSLALLDRDHFVQCECGDVSAWRWYAGGISLGAGLALGTAGLLNWYANDDAVVSVDPLHWPPLPAPAALRLTPAAGRQWPGLGLTGRF